MNQFWLDDQDAVWYVDAGTVMLYLATSDGAEPEQPRRFVFDVPAGCAMVAARSGLPSGMGLLCRTVADAVIRREAIATLDTLGAEPKLRIEEWMKGVMRDLDPKGAWLAVRRRRPRGGLVGGNEDTRVFHSRVFTFADMAVERIMINAKLEDQREAERLALEQANDKSRFAAAMGEISKGVSPEGDFGAPGPNDGVGEGLLAAFRFLEPSRRVRFVSSRDVGSADVTNETVELIAEASGLRARQVLLNGSWWDEEGGPMLARLSDNELSAGEPRHWVALLPGQVSGYQILSDRAMRDVASGSIVTEAIAHRLAPFAYTFYRTFPEGKLSALDVVRFGIQGKARDVWVLLLASFLAGMLGLLVPVVSGKIIDRVLPASDVMLLWQYISGLLVAGLSVLLFDTLRTVAILRIEARAGISVHAAILDRVISLPVTFFRKFSSGDLSVRMAAVNSIQHAVTGSTIGTILTSIFLVSNLALMLWYSVPLTMVVLVMVAVLFVVSSLIGYLRLQLARQIEDIGGKIQSLVFEYLSGISKIRTSASETRAFVNWTDRFINLRRLHVRSESLANAETLVLNILLPAMLLIVYYTASRASGSDGNGGHFATFTTGDFIAFNAALFALVGGLYGLMTTAIDLVQLLPVWERARPIVETLPESSGRSNAKHEPLGSIEIVNLGFRYADGPKVLDDVSFSVAPGAFVALVGSSGSGKSTLIRLLLGFERPTTGSICYDGHDLAGLDMRRLRARIGTVLQGGELWQGDIYANIAGANRIPVEDVWEATRIAGLREDIERMPMGLYTTIGDGDSTLSGGQRQRILIARAVVHQPRILLMDEATSALDNLTQSTVQRALSELSCTRLVIAHRLSTVRNADAIIVLDQGRLVEQGTFDQLAGKSGPFATMLQRQLI